MNVKKQKNKKPRNLKRFDVEGCLFANGQLKQGADFSRGILKLLPGENKNDTPFTVEDIKKEPLLRDFKFAGIEDFKYIGELKPSVICLVGEDNWHNEKIKISFDPQLSSISKNDFKNTLGCVYMITAMVNNQEHVIKYGATRTSMSSRIRSYNCGTINNWRTASTTNFKIMQSIMACRNGAVFKLYCYFCESTTTHVWHGVSSSPVASGRYLALEDIILKAWIKQFGKKPLANIQSNMTTPPAKALK